MARAANFEIVCDDTGASRRVWLECPVVAAQPIVQIQRQLASLPWAELAAPAYLHLTVLHLGKALDLYQELLSPLPELKWDDFHKAFLELLAQLWQLSEGPSQVQIVGLALDYFGSNMAPVLALVIEPIEDLEVLQQAACQPLYTFLATLGVADIQHYISDSPNLRWHGLPDNFQPHISLGRLHHTIAIPQITGLPVTLSLGKPRLANVRPG